MGKFMILKTMPDSQSMQN